MKLLHLTSYSPGDYTVMVENDEDGVYDLLSITPGEPMQIKARYPYKDFKDLEHFAGVIGKFMPYTWILGPGFEIEIQAPSLPELRRAAEILQKRNDQVDE